MFVQVVLGAVAKKEVLELVSMVAGNIVWVFTDVVVSMVACTIVLSGISVPLVAKVVCADGVEEGTDKGGGLEKKEEKGKDDTIVVVVIDTAVKKRAPGLASPGNSTMSFAVQIGSQERRQFCSIHIALLTHSPSGENSPGVAHSLQSR